MCKTSDIAGTDHWKSWCSGSKSPLRPVFRAHVSEDTAHDSICQALFGFVRKSLLYQPFFWAAVRFQGSCHTKTKIRVNSEPVGDNVSFAS